MKISVCIPIYNRSHMLLECLHTILTDDRVDDIVVCDDNSKDWVTSQNICDKLNDIQLLSGKDIKINFIKNSENKKGFYNKIRAVEHAKNDWVILLDSDNYLHASYLNKMLSIPLFDKKTVYCPEFAHPNFSYSHLCGLEIDYPCLERILNGKSQVMYDQIRLLLNTGNFMFNRNVYLGIIELEKDNLIEPYGVCSFYFNYLWLKNGYKINVVQGASYYHRIHDDSYWIQHDKISIDIASQFIQSINNNFSPINQLAP